MPSHMSNVYIYIYITEKRVKKIPKRQQTSKIPQHTTYAASRDVYADANAVICNIQTCKMRISLVHICISSCVIFLLSAFAFLLNAVIICYSQISNVPIFSFLGLFWKYNAILKICRTEKKKKRWWIRRQNIHSNQCSQEIPLRSMFFIHDLMNITIKPSNIKKIKNINYKSNIKKIILQFKIWALQQMRCLLYKTLVILLFQFAVLSLSILFFLAKLVMPHQ